jgi:hypothetical protein
VGAIPGKEAVTDAHSSIADVENSVRHRIVEKVGSEEIPLVPATFDPVSLAVNARLTRIAKETRKTSREVHSDCE